MPAFSFPQWFACMGFSRGKPGGRGSGKGDYEKAAALLGISASYVSALCRGEAKPGKLLVKECERLERGKDV